ncbi:MAG: hypothetical protein OXR66_08965 [Candidatus Woesearchaeota archaeon]|nr:hypothetical protein [Candidatus Woesearchaeota archaeon]
MNNTGADLDWVQIILILDLLEDHIQMLLGTVNIQQRMIEKRKKYDRY